MRSNLGARLGEAADHSVREIQAEEWTGSDFIRGPHAAAGLGKSLVPRRAGE